MRIHGTSSSSSLGHFQQRPVVAAAVVVVVVVREDRKTHVLWLRVCRGTSQSQSRLTGEH